MQRRTDGALLSTIGLGSDYQIERVQLSPDGAHAIVNFYDASAIGNEPLFPLVLFQSNGNSPSIDLLKEAPAGSSWVPTFAFQPDGQTMLGLLMPKGTGGATIMSIQLSTGALSPELTFHGYTGLDGVSAGCPIVNSTATFSGAWRACGSCNGPTFAPGTAQGIVSLDGQRLLQ